MAPPPRPDEWEVRFGDGDAADGWEDLCKQAAGATRSAYDAIARTPRDSSQPGRQHRLKGALGSRLVGGRELELALAATGHPKATE